MENKKHGSIIKLHKAKPQYNDKENSIFIYDEAMKVWFLKSVYDTLDADDEDTDFSRVPYLTDSSLRDFGEWVSIDV